MAAMAMLRALVRREYPDFDPEKSFEEQEDAIHAIYEHNHRAITIDYLLTCLLVLIPLATQLILQLLEG